MSVESTVVLQGRAAHAELPLPSSFAAPPPAMDSVRPVAFDVSLSSPSLPSLQAFVPPLPYTPGSGIHAVVEARPSSRMPALVTLTIALVAITFGVLLGSSLSQAVGATSAASQVAPLAVKAPEPRLAADDHVGLAGAGAVREKYVRPVRPVSFGFVPPRPSGQSASEADFNQRLEKAQKAAKPDTSALDEALLNRPF